MNGISVIIVSWNARAYLHACLQSVRACGRGGVVGEVIVVDNASSDGSAAMVRDAFPEVRLVEAGANLGFARANNLGMSLACGPLLALVNSDVEVRPGCFEALAGCLQSDPRIGLAGPRIVDRQGRAQGSCRRRPTVWNTLCRTLALDRVFGRHALLSGHEMRHFAHDTRAEAEVLSGCFWLARASAVAEVGPLDERFFFYMEDVDWCRRFAARGWRIVFEPAAVALHHGGASSANAPLRYSIQYLRSNLAYWRKYYGLAGDALFRSLALLHHGLRLAARGVRRLLGGVPSDPLRHKLREDLACLRWLLTGKDVA
ncbi:glycosyltransferase family 2 protein [Aquincola sp. MAHUQ-54]|uniref:Glycosyltransferase family 2 protein n=1 Tax=Aquincola agrisoli TaxID=3119538 RepID=A0AAW9QHG6_9BURK